MDRIAIVIPCFNEEDVLGLTADQLEIELFNIETSINVDFKIFFVDDGSSDRTFEIIKNLGKKNSKFTYIKLSRNFGHQAAVSAGITASLDSQATIILDADLQDPIDLVPTMIQKWREGADVVYGQRIKRHGESRLKLSTAKSFYKLINRLSNIQIPMDTGDFRLISNRVAKIISSMPENDRFIRGMVAWAGFEQVSIPYNRNPRAAGVSKYPFWKMVNFAVDGIISFSNRPLRLATYLGGIITLLAAGLGIYFFVGAIMGEQFERGWLTITLLLLFLGGTQLLVLGLIGEYLGRTYLQGKQRQLYIIEESSK